MGHTWLEVCSYRRVMFRPEGALFSRPFIGCLHDARSASGNDHVAVFAGFPGEFPRRFIRRFVIPDAGGAEDGNLADVAVRGENAVGAVHLPPERIRTVKSWSEAADWAMLIPVLIYSWR